MRSWFLLPVFSPYFSLFYTPIQWLHRALRMKIKMTCTPALALPPCLASLHNVSSPSLPWLGPSNSAFLFSPSYSLQPPGLCTCPVPRTLFSSHLVTAPLLQIAPRASLSAEKPSLTFTSPVPLTQARAAP